MNFSFVIFATKLGEVVKFFFSLLITGKNGLPFNILCLFFVVVAWKSLTTKSLSFIENYGYCLEVEKLLLKLEFIDEYLKDHTV